MIDVPLVLLGETNNGSGGAACAPSADNFQQYFSSAVSPALEIDVLAASHMSFLDDPNCGLPCLACPAGTDNPAVSRELAQGAMIAFFEYTLGEDDDYLDWLTGSGMQSYVDAGLLSFQSSGGF